MSMEGMAKEKDISVHRFGDHEEYDDLDVDALVNVLKTRHNTPVVIISGIGEASLVEVRFYTAEEQRMTVARGTSVQAALVLALRRIQ